MANPATWKDMDPTKTTMEEVYKVHITNTYIHEKNSVSDPNLFVLLDKSEKNLKKIIFVKYFKCTNNQLLLFYKTKKTKTSNFTCCMIF